MIELDEATALVLSRYPARPRVGVILGSGLGAVADRIEDRAEIPYGEIPGFPGTTVPGHHGRLVLGRLEGVHIAAMQGRPHFYEGNTPAQIRFPIHLLGRLGVRVLVVTNASGGLNPHLTQGSLLVLEDHINLPGMAGLNPLFGISGGAERFVNMSEAYDRELRELLLEAGRREGIKIAAGVYAMVAGPSFETPAEARMLRQLGADAVGMSTVPEVVVARSLGMRVAGISCVTNQLLGGTSHGEVEHLEVLSVAEATAPFVASLLQTILRQVAQDDR